MDATLLAEGQSWREGSQEWPLKGRYRDLNTDLARSASQTELAPLPVVDWGERHSRQRKDTPLQIPADQRPR